MNRSACLGTLAVLLVGTGSFAADYHGPARERGMLDSTQLRSLLRNVSLMPVPEPGLIASHVEVERFLENGEYLRLGGRATRSGTFAIENGRVCIRLSQIRAPDCYRLRRDLSGRLWKVDGDPHNAPIRISVLPTE